MEQPKGIDPAEWAKYNSQHRLQARLAAQGQAVHNSQLDAVLDLAPYAIEVVELPPAVTDLTLSVRRAASELEGTSEKADRVALQLLTALAHFAKDTGT